MQHFIASVVTFSPTLYIPGFVNISAYLKSESMHFFLSLCDILYPQALILMIIFIFFKLKIYFIKC